VRPPRPVRVEPPFLSIYTPTFRRPAQLAACLASVGKQTAADDLEHIVHPDHVGHGVAGALFGRLERIAPALQGRYVNLLCDDDVLAGDNVVEIVRDFAERRHYPEVITTRVQKGPLRLPLCDPEGEPICGQVDLTSFIVRGDVWHEHFKDYGLRYEGDWDHAHAMWKVGRQFTFCDVLWAIGAQSNGRPEMDY
jgi:hypothetical protein